MIKDKITDVLGEKKYHLKNICWIRKLDKNGQMQIFPIIFSNDSSKILDIFRNKKYDAFLEVEVSHKYGESKKFYSKDLPYELKKDYSMDGEIRDYYISWEIELASSFSLLEHDHRGYILYENSLAKKNYCDKCVSKRELKKICDIYEKYFQKEHQNKLDEFNSKNFGTEQTKSRKFILPYTNYSINFILKDIYFIVEKGKSGITSVTPYVLTHSEKYGFDYIKSLKYYKDLFSLDKHSNLSMETNILLTLADKLSITVGSEVLNIEDLVKRTGVIKHKNYKDLDKFKNAKFSALEIKEIAEEYEKILNGNTSKKDKNDSQKDEKDPILEYEFSL